MSKRSTNSTSLIDPTDEKYIATLLTSHINDRKEGVIVRPSDPNAFPLVDAVGIAGAWKLNYSTRFSRYNKSTLEGVIKSVYNNLAADHKAKQQPQAAATPQQQTTQQPQGKRPVKIKETTVVKRQKNNTFIAPNDNVQLGSTSTTPSSTPNTPLKAGASAMSMAKAVASVSNSFTQGGDNLFAPTVFDDMFTSTPPNTTPISQQSSSKTTSMDTNDDIDSDDDLDDSDIDLSDVDIDLAGVDDDMDQEMIDEMLRNDSDDSDVTELDNQTRNLNISNGIPNSPPQQQQQQQQQGKNNLVQPAKAVVNNSINQMYNPTAVPYSQRPQPQSLGDNNTHNNGKPLTKRQLQDKAVREIQREGKQNVPLAVKLKQRYKAYRDLSYGHREAEALARQELGMDYNPQFLPPGGVEAARKNNKPGKNGSTGNSGGKNGKDEKPTIVPIRPNVSLKDVGGIDGIVQEIREIIEYPLTHPEIFTHLGVSPPKGVLLHGPPGSGKTLLANAIAGELNIPLIKVQATEIVSKLSGESEGKIRSIFTDAAQHAPCIIFIDDIDVLAGKKDSEDGNDMKRRIVTQLIASIDSLGVDPSTGVDGTPSTDLDNDEFLARQAMGEVKFDANGDIITKKGEMTAAERAMKEGNDDDLMFRTAMMNNNNSNKTIIVLGATSRLDTIDPALRRAGRFDREIALGIPDEFARAQILKKLTQKMRLADNCNLDIIGKQTVGFVGADLLALTREAAVLSLNRIFTNEKVWSSNGSGFEKYVASSGLASPQDLAVQLVSNIPNDPSTTSMGDDDVDSEPTNTNPAIDSAAPVLPLTKTQQKRFDLAQRTKISLFLRSCGPLTPTQLEPFSITHEDFSSASKKVQPTAKREGFATVPETTWADVGALDLLRAELDMAIVQPIQEPELFEQLGLNTPAGVLLFGPPGCGKTLVAKAVANASGASFLSVKGPELLNQYVGESERAVRNVFQRAQMCSPCVIFFDEIDALVPRRGGSSGNQASERVVNQLLTELDGFDDRRQVFVIAATNRPDIIDPAVLRPGRLDKLLYLPLPDAEGRKSILMKHTRRTPFDYDNLPGSDNEAKREALLHKVCFDERAENYSGADMQALVREATTAALKEYQTKRANIIISGGDLSTLNSKVLVTPDHFDIAFGRVVASVSAKARKEYEQLCQTMTQGKGVLRKDVHSVQDGSQTGGTSR